MPVIEELPIPGPVLAATRTAEMARVWLADGNQVVTISSRLWEDPGAWGLMLVDLARHVAQAYEAKGFSATDVLTRIRSAMEAEWTSPTD